VGSDKCENMLSRLASQVSRSSEADDLSNADASARPVGRDGNAVHVDVFGGGGCLFKEKWQRSLKEVLEYRKRRARERELRTSCVTGLEAAYLPCFDTWKLPHLAITCQSMWEEENMRFRTKVTKNHRIRVPLYCDLNWLTTKLRVGLYSKFVDSRLTCGTEKLKKDTAFLDHTWWGADASKLERYDHDLYSPCSLM
jgi:hypothetical protein